MITRLLASSNYLVLNKDLIKIFGLDCAVFLSEIVGENEYWNEQGKLEDGWFYSTIDNVEEHTGLSDFEQRKAINKLREYKIIECKKQGLPAKRYIKINKKQLVEFFKKYILNNSRSSSLKIEELDLDFLDSNNNNNNSNNNNNNNSNKENFEKNENKTKSNPKYLQKSKYLDTAKKLKTDDVFLMQITSAHNINTSVARKLLEFFVKINKDKEANERDFRNHFENWLKTRGGEKAIEDMKTSQRGIIYDNSYQH